MTTKWTKEAPTEEGYYWVYCRLPEEGTVDPVVDLARVSVFYGSDRKRVLLVKRESGKQTLKRFYEQRERVSSVIYSKRIDLTHDTGALRDACFLRDGADLYVYANVGVHAFPPSGGQAVPRHEIRKYRYDGKGAYDSVYTNITATFKETL